MSLVDSLDSIVMLYSYSGFIESKKRFSVLERHTSNDTPVASENEKETEQVQAERKENSGTITGEPTTTAPAEQSLAYVAPFSCWESTSRFQWRTSPWERRASTLLLAPGGRGQ